MMLTRHAAAFALVVPLAVSSCSPDPSPRAGSSVSEEASPKVVELPLPPNPQLPGDQKNFVSRVADFKARLSLPENPIQDTRLVSAFCSEQKSKSFSGWIARLEEITAPGPLDENGEVGVKLSVGELHYRRAGETSVFLEMQEYDDDGRATSVKLGTLRGDRKREILHKTHVRPDSKVYSSLSTLTVGDLVEVSGVFVDGAPVVTSFDGGLVDYNYCIAINDGPVIGKASGRDFFGGDHVASYAVKLTSVSKWVPAN